MKFGPGHFCEKLHYSFNFGPGSDTPIHGVGQGGTASPAFWLLVTSLLFDCHNENANGMLMSDPTGTLSLRQWLEALVDDSSIFTNVSGNQSVSDLTDLLQQDAQYWENLLSTSGGCLELSKCFYFVLAWTFTANGDPIPLTPDEIARQSSPITLQEFGKDTSTQIELKAPETAHKTLGVWKSMIGNDATHVKHMKTRSLNMSSIVATCGLRPYQADVALRMIYTPSMTYSLPAVNLSEKVLYKIQEKALESFSPAMGFNRNFPRAVLLSPKEFGGEGIPHLYTESNIQKIEIIMSNIRGQTELGKLFCINLSYINLLSGRAESYLESHYDLPYINNWFTGIRKFLIQVNGKLKIPSLFNPSLERNDDILIMEAMSNSYPKLSANQLRHINNWRYFFQVNTISDMCNAKGDMLLDVYMKYPTQSHINLIRLDRTSRLKWPIQPPPESLSSLKLWVRYIRICFLQQSGNKLRSHLGVWFPHSDTSLSKWKRYFYPDQQILLIRDANTFLRYSSVIHSTPGTITFASDHSRSHQSIPATFIPVDFDILAENNIKVYHSQRMPGIKAPPILTNNDNLQEVIAHLPLWQKSLLQHFRIHDLQYLIECIASLEIKIYLVSDGGLKDQRGSFGVSTGTIESELYSIEGPAPGNQEHTNLYRSEAYGLLAGLNFFRLFLQTYNITLPRTRRLYMFCDNLSLVRCIQKIIINQTFPRMFLRSDSDVILQIAQDVHHLQSLGLDIILDHVKGHQDELIQYSDLSRESQLNVAADSYATNYLRSGGMIEYEALPANPINLYLNEHIINRDIKKELRIASLSPELRTYMIKRFQWQHNTPDLVWWMVHGSTIKSFYSPDRRRIRKIIFGWLPTCVRLKKYHTELSDICPSCNTHPEANDHLFKCQCRSRIIVKNKWLEAFDSFLSNTRNTPYIIRQLFFNHMLVLFSLETVIMPTIIPGNIKKAITDQDTIGWKHLLFGRLAFRWSTIIADHLECNKVDNKEMSPLVWGRRIVRLLLDVMLNIWKQRNLDGHLITQQNESNLTRIRLLQRIEFVQSHDHNIPHHHRDFVYRRADILHLYTNSNLRSWLKMAENIIRLSNPRRRAPNERSQFWISQPNDPSLVVAS